MDPAVDSLNADPASPPAAQATHWYSPVTNAVQRVWETVVGYFARIFIFRGAVAHNFCSRFFLGMTDSERYEVTTHGPVNPERIERLRQGLLVLGGVEKNVQGIQMILLRVSAFRQKIQEAGGTLINEAGVWKIQPPVENSAAWDVFASALTDFCEENTAVYTGWDHQFNLGTASNAPAGTCLLRCRGPGGAFESKKFITGYLGAGIDLCLFNWPGMCASQGNASEAAYNQAAETVYQELIQTEQYSPQRLHISGFCLGGAVAAYLFKAHYQEGVHLILENTFSSMERMIRHLTGYDSLARIGAASLKEDGIEDQNGFNTVALLNAIPDHAAASIRVVSTENDTAVPPDSHLQFAQAAQRCANVYDSLRWRNDYVSGHQPHGDEPLHYRANWNQHLAWFA